jgi:hypothetical protein
MEITIEDTADKPPSKILAFDSAKERAPAPVDLDAPFFTIARPDYSKCNHRNRGVTLDTATRKAICLCGVEIDNFDALLIYAHAQQRLIHHAEAIAEHERKEAEKKAAKPFVRDVSGFCQQHSKRGRFLGWALRLECGHAASSDRRRPPRRVTCHECVRNAKLTTAGVAVADTQRKDLVNV